MAAYLLPMSASFSLCRRCASCLHCDSFIETHGYRGLAFEKFPPQAAGEPRTFILRPDITGRAELAASRAC